MDPDHLVIAEAAQRLKSGNLVAIPTETVYGLAAPIDQEEALKKVFTVKERPAFDPLIVHVHSVDQAKELTLNWPKAADALARAFWPGPLTIVLTKSSRVSDLITSGLPTVAIRMPKHKIALALLQEVGVPLAAPSANKFGKTSPTRAEHVHREFSSDEVMVIDGGPTDVGLESSIIKLSELDGVTMLEILRPGMISADDLSKALDAESISYTFAQTGNSTEAPGQMEDHYMPRIPLVLVDAKDKGKNLLNICSKRLDTKMQYPKELKLDDDPRLAARELYGQLRDLSDSTADCIFYFCKEENVGPYWTAIFDRLTKAASVDLRDNPTRL